MGNGESKGRTATRARAKTGRAPGRRVSRASPRGEPLEPPSRPGGTGAMAAAEKRLQAAPMAVRATTPADAAAVAALWVELIRIHESMGEEWRAAEGAAERYARGVAAAPGNPRLLFLVAEMEIDGSRRLAGFLHAAVKLRNAVFRESVVGEIPAICVAPDVAGRGVGSALVAAAMEWFRSRNISHVEAVMAAGNATARSFWEAMGFRESASILWASTPPPADPAVDPTAGPGGDPASAELPESG